jgi:hypothetical protein
MASPQVLGAGHTSVRIEVLLARSQSKQTSSQEMSERGKNYANVMVAEGARSALVFADRLANGCSRRRTSITPCGTQSLVMPGARHARCAAIVATDGQSIHNRVHTDV